MKEQNLQKLFDWMRRASPKVQAAMVRFPPCCHVRALTKLHMPPPGETGQVCCYHERKPQGDVTVYVQLPDRGQGECLLDWIEVAAYQDNITPDVVRMVCGLSEDA